MNDAYSIMKFNSIDTLFETKIKNMKKNNGDSKPMKQPHIDNNQITLFSQSETERTYKSKLRFTNTNSENNLFFTSKNIEPKENEININKEAKKLKLPLMVSRKRSSSAFFLNQIYSSGTHSIELTDCPYIYSYKKFHPFSFMTGHKKTGFNQKKNILKYPSPTFIENELWIKKPNLTKNEILKGMIINNEKGLVLIDKEMTKKFKGIIGDILKQLFKAIFGHKISLNVKLFEPKSILQTITDYWCFIPKFFPMALNENLNPVNRMKIIMSFGVSGLYLNAKQLKPFNPLITETFQGIFENETKTEVYLEQISNYPTISRFYIKDINFIMSGYYDLSVEMESLGSKITALTKGYAKIDFVNINESIIYILPQAKILNAISEEDRSAYYISVMIFYDIKNNLKGVIQFGKDKKCIHKIKGIIYDYKYKNSKIDYEKDREKLNKLDLDNLNKEYNIKAKLSGSWLKEVIIDNEKFWDIDVDIPFWIKPVQKCLPSDCRFREDLIWLFRSFYCSKNEDERLKYEHLAQEWKLIIEKLQRDEREHKAKMNKIREKEKKKKKM